MQHVGAVGIDHALRVASGAGCVAHPRRRPLIELRPGKIAIGFGDVALIGNHILQRCLGHVRIVRQDDDTFEAGDLGGNHLQQLDEGEIDEEHLVFGVVHDPGDLVGKQPGIERVVDRPDTQNAVPGLEMTPCVPGHRGDTIAHPAAIPVEALSKLERASANLCIVGSVERTFDRSRHDLPLSVVDSRMIDDLVAEQRPFLHHSKHMIPLVFHPLPGSNSSASGGAETTLNYIEFDVLHISDFSIVLNKPKLRIWVRLRAAL